MKTIESLGRGLVGLALFSAGAIAQPELVQLRTGKLIAGDVRLEGSETVIVDATFPAVATLTFKRSELAPESLYTILDRRTDPRDAAKRRELADLAEQEGLKAIAVAEYRAVIRLDPSSKADLEPRVTQLVESIAEDVLRDARDLLQDGNADAALMYLHALVDYHPDTKAAQSAKSLMLDLRRTAAASADFATETVPEAEAPALLTAVLAHLEVGDERMRPAAGHASSSIADQRAVERAIPHYERAWESAQRLPVTVQASDLRARIEATRRGAKSKLVDAYLTAGTIHLQRRSIASAERYCDQACLLDPGNRQNHELHRLIIEAKAFSGWGSGTLR